jgi:putative hydrolase of the HAD superfamily
MPGAYRAIIFDFFGTLTSAVTRGPAHAPIARRLGCEPDAFARALDVTFRDRSVGAYGDPAQALTAVARLAGGDPSATAVASVLPDRIEAIATDTRLRPEAPYVLDTLRRFGFRTAIISDCGPELPVFLPSLPIAPHVETCVFSIDIGHRKPEPIMYETACARLGVEPAQCLYIGDGGSRELSGAAAAGMSAVRLSSPDLGTHLVFDHDDGWCGPEIESLTDVLDAAFGLRRLTGFARPGVAV